METRLAAVINNDQLEIGEFARENRFDRFLEKFFGVINWHYYGNERHCPLSRFEI
jgi:hypothetical protein